MSIFINNNTRVLIQGITGREGRFHCGRCLAYGTRVVAGVTPGKGGQEVDGIPVYNTVREGALVSGANCSMVFVPPAFAALAIMEAADADIPMIIAITEGIPLLDMMRVKNYLQTKTTRLIGPNCPGIITPGQCKAGIMPGEIHRPGPVGVISRSGTLTYEVVSQLSRLGIGQSTCVGIGGDPICGTGFKDCLAAFEKDDATRGIVMVGEIGGAAEEEACAYISRHVTKPVVGFVAGLTAPSGRRLGHAGAIVSGGSGTAQAKVAAMRMAGVHVCEDLAGMGEFCAEIFRDFCQDEFIAEVNQERFK